jgi:hypothetical protein
MTLGLWLLATIATAADWQPDYKTAYESAKKDSKPLMVYFTSGEDKGAVDAKVQQSSDANAFVLLLADARTPAGKATFDLFNFKASEGVVVLDKTQAWQFSRYERKLSDSDLKLVLSATKNATGQPQVPDVLGGNGERGAGYYSPNGATGGDAGFYCPNCVRSRR